MIGKNKRNLVALLLSAMFIPVSAQTAEQALIVEMKSGEQVSFAFSDNPVLSFNGSNLVVNTNLYEFTYDADTIQRYLFGTANPTAITLPTVDGSLVDGNLLSLHLGKAYATATVYAVDGKAVLTATTDEQGVAQLSLVGLPAGVYIVKSDNFLTKILKR